MSKETEDRQLDRFRNLGVRSCCDVTAYVVFTPELLRKATLVMTNDSATGGGVVFEVTISDGKSFLTFAGPKKMSSEDGKPTIEIGITQKCE